MDAEDDGTTALPSINCDGGGSNNAITVEITPTDDINPTVSDMPSPSDSNKMQTDSLPNNLESNDSIPDNAMELGPPRSNASISNIGPFSINSQSIGSKSLPSPAPLPEKSGGSKSVTNITIVPPMNKIPFLGSSLAPPAANKSSKMSTLSAPTQVASSVRTANQPKSSLSLQVDNLTTASATGNPRNKVALRRGRGLMDWVRLGHSCPDLAGTGGRLLQVTPKQLAKHNTRKDAWMALKGKVYNVTPYFEYHPGGEDELIKGVGIDATDLFNEVHKWVNYEAMLSKCLVGYLVEDSPTSCSAALRSSSKSKSKPNAVSASNNSLNVSSVPRLPPIPTLPSPQDQMPRPSYDWHQTATSINVAVYTRWPAVTVRHCSLSVNSKVLSVDVIVRDKCYQLMLDLLRPVIPSKIKVSTGGGRSGKLVLELPKAEDGVRWSSIGRTLPGNDSLVKLCDRENSYHRCRLVVKQQLTHDTVLLSLRCPSHVFAPVPPGYHTFLRMPGSVLSKPYTPVPASLDVEEWVKPQCSPGNTIHYLVKVYPDGPMSTALNAVTVCPDDGAGQQHMDEEPESCVVEVTLAEGDHVSVLSWGPNEGADPPLSDVALLAAGTGITPMVALMLDSVVQRRRVRLVFFNKTEQDIPWREELELFAAAHDSLVRVHHVLSSPVASWQQLRGRVSTEILEPLLPVADGGGSVFLAVCGPRPFTDTALSVFGELGYLSEEYHAFVG